MIKFKMLSQTSSSNSSNRDQTNIYIYLNKIQPSLNTERYGIRPSRRGYQKLNLSISISCIPFRMLNEIINYTQIAHHFFSICQPASQCPYGCWRHCVFAVSPETQHTAVGKLNQQTVNPCPSSGHVFVQGQGQLQPFIHVSWSLISSKDEFGWNKIIPNAECWIPF